MYKKEMNPVLQYAIKYSVYDLCTYHGYDGADILKLTFKEREALIAVRDLCNTLHIKTSTSVIDNKHELHCIFEVPDDIYSLKD